MNDIKKLLDLFDKSNGVSTDSRQIKKGQIYFALKGEHFDGNAFVKDAIEKGALAAVVSDRGLKDLERCIYVEDVLSSLQALSRAHRRRFEGPVIAITGTNGKTTTKELLNAVLSVKYKVHATSGNFNNHIGVPLTLLQLNLDDDVAIIEMGASSVGEIELLCQIAEPTSGIITNIGKAHIEGFGSVENIIIAKGELYDYLNETKGLIFMPESLHKIDHFGQLNYPEAILYSSSDMKGKEIESLKLLENNPCVKLRVFGKGKQKVDIQSALFGNYNFHNMANVLKIADHYDVSVLEAKKGLEAYIPSNNRSQLKHDARNNSIILDAYNANPSSIQAALDHFLALEFDGHKWAILGDMLELGASAMVEHEKIIEYISERNDVKAVLVGEEFFKARLTGQMKAAANMIFFQDASECRKWWKANEISNSMVLVKGSRGIALESIFILDVIHS